MTPQEWADLDSPVGTMPTGAEWASGAQDSIAPAVKSWDGVPVEERKAFFRRANAECRANKKAQRGMDIALNQRAFHGRVDMGTELCKIIFAPEAKLVRTRHGKVAIRTQFTGTLQCGDRTYGPAHFIVLYDTRLDEPHMGTAHAEILWTGKDWRVHIRRASPLNQQVRVSLDIGF